MKDTNIKVEGGLRTKAEALESSKLKKVFESSPIEWEKKMENFPKYIKRQNPYSLVAVKELLNKFKDNIHLIKGNSNYILNKIDMKKIDYVFLDGGHEYNTVKNDLESCKKVILNNGVVLCDDYDLSYAPGVKKAIDEFIEKYNFKSSIISNGRFAKIEKN